MRSDMCEGVDNAKEENRNAGIKLKFGRPVITDRGEFGLYLRPHGAWGHFVLVDSRFLLRDHVKPDPDGTPMNGDDVEVSDNNKKWIKAQYFGYDVSSDTHVVGLCRNDVVGIAGHWKQVRHPQPSKRERVINRITNIKIDSDVEQVADEILKICEVKE